MLVLTGICKTYNDGQAVHASRNVTLCIREGEYFTVTGASGSGKSTLLNIMGLLDRPTEGRYEVAGVETTKLSEATRGALRGQLFGFVFQAFHLLPGRTALENVEMGMLYSPRSPKQRRRLAVDALERMGLAHKAHSDPRQLSGGERQRVAIARAIAGQPRVLFCDEPTGNLDSANTENVLSVLAGLNASGLTLVVVTHDLEVAKRGSRRISVSDGIVSDEGGPAAIG